MVVLELTDWRLNAYQPYVPILNRSVETGGVLGGILHPLEAKVPGSVYHDLWRAGILEDPYFERNSLQCAWVNDYWWMYETSFSTADIPAGKRLRLRFDGIDYKGYISLNGKLIHTHTGAQIPCVLDITDRLSESGTNSLKVTLEQAPVEMGQIGYTSRVRHLKPRFTYRWDFAPMLVSMGLYGPVTLEASGDVAVEESFVAPREENGTWYIDCRNALSASREVRAAVVYRAYDGDTLVAEGRAEAQAGPGNFETQASLKIPNPRLWWPNGHGEQPLYRVAIDVYADGELSDKLELSTGLRTLEYRRCSGASEDSLPYLPVINGKPVYIKGVNMVPLDSMYGAVSQEKVETWLEAVKASNANLIRVWGGGLYESEFFYETCDRLGLMILQDFPQSSSGIDNIPSKDPTFLSQLEQSAEAAVKSRRNHVSLTFWCGGNELMMLSADGTPVPADFSDENIAMLRRIVQTWNPGVQILPTTASGPNCSINPQDPGRNHDVHGPWQYHYEHNGVRYEYHQLYNSSDSQLHSEMGVDGMGNLETIRKILLPENQKVTTAWDNLTWRHHGEWWDTRSRDESFFGRFEEDALEEYILCSQMIQYEGVRYALESNRCRAFQNCGSILWQFNEPWPNVSCTNIWDYYGKPKAAYYAVQAAYRPVAPVLKYDTLFPKAGEAVILRPFICNDGEGANGVFQISVSLNGVEIQTASGQTTLCANGPTKLESLTAVPMEKGYMEARLTWTDEAGNTVESVYPFFVVTEGGDADRQYAVRFVNSLMKSKE